MAGVFNVYGACKPDRHYMVDLESRLEKIKKMIDAGEYFTINRARQYGKTTTLRALVGYLKKNYQVVSLDFQRISSLSFESEQAFVAAFSEELLHYVKRFPEGVEEKLRAFVDGTARINSLQALFKALNMWCGKSEKPIVLIIDEVDTASNNQVFLDFLAQLRAAYLDSDVTPTFQAVILAGVYDVRSIKGKIRSDSEHKENSPWNTREGNESSESLLAFDDCPWDHRELAPYDIAAKFNVDMSFSAEEIAGMLRQYEADYHTGMDIDLISKLIYDYTSGYPYLVSGLCKNLDEEISGTKEFPDKSSAWTKEGFYEAEKMLVKEDNTLYQSLIRKLKLYPELRNVLYELLFTGKPIPYVATNDYMKDAVMFGFIKNDHDTAIISNRIFETVLYNYFISEEFATSKMYNAGTHEKNQFIVGGHLDVRRILEKFVETFDYLYGNQDETFLEEVGRRYFLLFLKPIINGVGNYSIEPQTRNNERMDVVIYYHSEQFIIEMKVWRGNAYNQRGEKQLSNYLDYYHLKKGYMLSFNFNKTKEVGVKEIALGDRLLIEAVV